MTYAIPGPSGLQQQAKKSGFQPSLLSGEDAAAPAFKINGNANKLDVRDRHFHDWYRFVLSFPAHLVRDYLQGFDLGEQDTVLDPFCGTGTTLVEAKLQGIRGRKADAAANPAGGAGQLAAERFNQSAAFAQGSDSA